MSDLVTAERAESFFYLQGRRYVEGGRLFLNHSGGSIKGLFKGKSLVIDLFSDFEISDRNTYIRLTIDGRTKRMRLPKGVKRILSSFPEGEHLFEIVKLTEATNNSLGFLGAETDGEFLPYREEKKYKIEFIGDSITTGFGVLARNKEGEYRTSEQDATKAFPHLVSKALDASYHTVAAGGWPIYRSKYADYAIPDFYDHIDFMRNPDKWDFSAFRPDCIVVTLGTNDFSYLSDLSEEDRRREREETKKHFLSFLRRLLEEKVPIVLVYGFFVYPDLGAMTEEVKKELDSPLISTLEVRSALSLSDICAGHPGKKTHRLAANRLTRHLKRIIF